MDAYSSDIAQDHMDNFSDDSTGDPTGEDLPFNPYHLPWGALPFALPSTLSLAGSKTALEYHKAFYTAVVALARGSQIPTRRSLPTELVIYICRLAEFGYINPAYTQESQLEDVEIGAHGARIATKRWFETRPFTRHELSRIKSIQLVTLSRHQGWAAYQGGGSWSWFDLRVVRPRRFNGASSSGDRHSYSEMLWHSHTHPYESRDYGEHRGVLFDYNNQIWGLIEEGDSIQVLMRAQFRGWENLARHGILEVVTWLEPSAEMLNMIRGNVGPIGL